MGEYDSKKRKRCKQNVKRQALGEDLLFAKMAEPDKTAVTFKNPCRNLMGKIDRGHLVIFPKFWILRPYGKKIEEITRNSRLLSEFLVTMEEYLEKIINGLWNVSLFRNAHGDGGQTAEFAVDGSNNTPF